jgi:DNA-binding MarR family transcriptional regulator
MTTPTGAVNAGDDLLTDAEALERALFQLTRLERRLFVLHLERFELTPAQYLALVQLARVGHGCTMGHLATDLQQSSATITGVVDRLVRQDLAERRADPSDRRRVIVALTDAGRHLLGEAYEVKRQRATEVLATFSRADRALLVSLLETYKERMAERVHLPERG